MSFQVTYTSASADDVAITPTSGIVTLANQKNETAIIVEVINDAVPEESESLRVELTSTTGDTVLVTPTSATINILPNDDPNGVFQFAANSRNFTAEEGDTLQIMYGTFHPSSLPLSMYTLYLVLTFLGTNSLLSNAA